MTMSEARYTEIILQMLSYFIYPGQTKRSKPHLSLNLTYHCAKQIQPCVLRIVRQRATPHALFVI